MGMYFGLRGGAGGEAEGRGRGGGLRGGAGGRFEVRSGGEVSWAEGWGGGEAEGIMGQGWGGMKV